MGDAVVDVVWRAAIVYLFLLLFTRALGKRELAEMSAFELIVLVTIGDLVQQGVTQEDFSVTGSVLAVSTFGFLALIGSYVSFRFPRTQPLLEGRPVVVIHDGRLLEDVLHIERLSDDEVKEEARTQGIADLSDVRLGILEPDGKFSFIKNDESQHRADEKHQA
ncbi:MAG TPA: YetF domain-containing protein [Mycobacteriales bacterium]|nr:YetF domain-containing protein [Mycobacteriales bacterium]